jgi:transposase
VALGARIAADPAGCRCLCKPARLDEIHGTGPAAAATLIAGIGTSMSRFPTPGHLVSWVKYAPGASESAGKKKGKNTTGHGNPRLRRRSAGCCRAPIWAPIFGLVPSARPGLLVSGPEASPAEQLAGPA